MSSPPPPPPLKTRPGKDDTVMLWLFVCIGLIALPFLFWGGVRALAWAIVWTGGLPS